MTARMEPVAEPYPADVQAVFDRLPRSWMPPFALFTTLARHGELFERFRTSPGRFRPPDSGSLHRIHSQQGDHHERH